MKTAIRFPIHREMRRLRFIFRAAHFGILTLLAAVTVGRLSATTVTTLTGGPNALNPLTYGHTDGDTAGFAQFHTPYGLALDSTGANLYVADRDNNAIRWLDLGAGQTYTLIPNETVPTNLISSPVGVAVVGGYIYVLNRGNGTNGTVLKFDTAFGELVATNATGLTNAAGITLDGAGNIYVTAQSNVIVRITAAGVRTNLVTVTNAGASLQGLISKRNGLIAVCDSGRHGIYLIDPVTRTVTTNAGFHGAGDFSAANNIASSGTAKFNQPYGVTETGDGTLVVTDKNNHRVKLVGTTGIVTNLYAVSSNSWYTGPGATYIGWVDGPVTVPDGPGGVEARQPVGVVFAPDGSVYVSEQYYHIIRHVTGAGLALPPPPPPPVTPPVIGWVNFVGTPPLTLLVPGSSFVFNNDVIIAIKGTNGSQTFYTAGPTPIIGTIPDPSPTNGTTPPFYADGLSSATDLGTTRYPDMTIKAIGTKSDGSPNSSITQARFQFVVANPLLNGNNGAQFTVSDETAGAQMWYTTDGSTPSNAPPSIGPIASASTLSLNVITNFTFKIRAFRDSYQPSGVVSAEFSPTNFIANRISFGFQSGEASSDFVASPGQHFFAPVTLTLLGGAKMYSLQFNLMATNLTGPAIANGDISFQSMLVKPLPSNPLVYEIIPPAMFVATNPPPGQGVFLDGSSNFTSLIFVNNNLMGVGWLERLTYTNLYDTTKQDVITFSRAHDNIFSSSAGRVIAGGFSFGVPAAAVNGQKYQLQIGRPSATSDGIGTPGSDVYIATPTNGSLAGGTINSIKEVTVGQRKYLAGDAAPFRWFNAGDFGNTNLANNDVMQVFQSAVYAINFPPAGSDFFDGMDSCCGVGAPTVNGYWLPTGGSAPTDPLYVGTDATIDTVAFGDKFLDVTDVYVTFRRSLDPSRTWFRRFWTNGVLAAETAPNVFSLTGGSPKKLNSLFTPNSNDRPTAYSVSPGVSFSAGDAIATSGQTLSIPINARVFGGYPLRVLMLNLTVVPLDGSPALTQQVQFNTASGGLGSPTLTTSDSLANFAGTWLNSTIPGIASNGLIGNLQITLPTNCPAGAAYAVHFDHVSGSPNGLATFPANELTGLVTLANRSASSWGDGIPDSWRLRYFGTTNNLLSASSADADGDGSDNWTEFKAGTNPNDVRSVLKMLTHLGDPEACVLHWPTVLNKQYMVERSPSFSGGNWSPISTNTGTGGELLFSDASIVYGVRIYRVRVVE